MTTGYRYPVRRKERRKTKVEGRDRYLRETVRLAGAELCQAMHMIPGALHRDIMEKQDVWKGFPWLTLVVGSGCLELPIKTDFTPERVAAAVKDLVEAGTVVPLPSGVKDTGHKHVPEFVERYTQQLVASRVPLSHGSSAAETRPKVPVMAARFVALAALLTRFFYLSRAAVPAALSRWDDDIAELPYDSEPDPAPLLDSPAGVASLAMRIANQLAEEDLKAAGEQPQNVRDAATKLLNDVRKGLRAPNDEYEQPRRLRADHVRLVTEVAWFFVHSQSLVYPGWTDLLVRMMLREGEPGIEAVGRPRPRETPIVEVPGVVEGLLDEITGNSWATYLVTADDAPSDPPDEADRAKGESERDRLYLSIADVLWSQAAALAEVPEGARWQLPAPSAFVTSFDLELDMAMMATADGRGFFVAVPVHVLDDEDSAEAAFCWLVAEVDPLPERSAAAVEGLERLRNPRNWRVLRERNETGIPLHERPTIVHLTGCPLFAVPDLGDPANEALVQDLRDLDLGDAALVQHAVTIDEYLALRQSSAELFWTTHRNGEISRALPRQLTENTKGNPRYWMALGVPMDDPAVRNRFSSQLTLNWLREGGGGSERTHPVPSPGGRLAAAKPPGGGRLAAARPVQEPETAREDDGDAPTGHEALESPGAGVHGIAINTRMSADEVGLLHWLGLDVVDADCHAFTPDLRHYARHVREPGPRKHPPLFVECPLKTKEDRR